MPSSNPCRYRTSAKRAYARHIFHELDALCQKSTSPITTLPLLRRSLSELVRYLQYEEDRGHGGTRLVRRTYAVFEVAYHEILCVLRWWPAEPQHKSGHGKVWEVLGVKISSLIESAKVLAQHELQRALERVRDEARGLLVPGSAVTEKTDVAGLQEAEKPAVKLAAGGLHAAGFQCLYASWCWTGVYLQCQKLKELERERVEHGAWLCEHPGLDKY